ncbi:amino acid/amide ABC transporter membrane protein 2 (HAAT family) [Arthrobacter sp. AG367]|uniref:branched-chain amino acid ABC transporter permease n=1 Tax=Arthrobacter sp. AG367 TaxID=2572909 RepID=UPI00119D3808|nr:branched-chain amino acid ABC transporter permease [Arthrobacter sp. AG367]TWD47069.1 amino acid/amide ABC transporter membrane protein 2 (HAAT family) [Arthrobacter sp. AG367]
MKLPFTLAQDRIQTRRGFGAAVAGPTSIAVVVVVIAILINEFSLGRFEDVLLSAMVFACLTVSLQALMGNTGLIFFGQFAFVAVGAYVSGVLTVPASARGTLLPDLPDWLSGIELGFWASVVAGALAAGVVALIASPVLVRVSGLAAAVVSLGLMFIVSDLLRETPSITRGAQVFSGVPYDTTLLTAGIVLTVTTLAAAAFKFSRWGLEARGGRDDSVAAESSGLSMARVRTPALLLGGLLSGAAGAVWAHYLTAFSPVTFGIDPAVVVVIMAVIGGVNSVSGALVGATIIAVWQELARQVEGGLVVFGLQLPRMPEFSALTLGVGLIVVLAIRPRGLLASRELQWFRPRAPQRAAAIEEPARESSAEAEPTEVRA